MKNLFKVMVLIIGTGFILIFSGSKVDGDLEKEVEDSEKRSVFISYIELGQYLKNKDEKSSKENIDLMINNVKSLGFNEIIVQVRSFCDAIYPSKIYPWSSVITGNESVSYSYDVLDYFINKAHSEEINFIAWINPYRIRSGSDITSIGMNSPAYVHLNSDVVYVGEGIYFNPSKKVVQDLIISGVSELVNNYEVDGILFDDYFYPNNEIDVKDYEFYLENNEYISKAEYNLNVISDLIRKVYEVCHKKNILFGISPDGNMENNYNKVFADVKKWCSDFGYIDFIMPQVYYGFHNETKAFKSVVDEWESIVLNDDVELGIALAFYKVGTVDEYAKSGRFEWMIYGDIIMREIVLSRNLKKYRGFGLFRYDYLFNEELHNEMTLNEIENMKKVLN